MSFCAQQQGNDRTNRQSARELGKREIMTQLEEDHAELYDGLFGDDDDTFHEIIDDLEPDRYFAEDYRNNNLDDDWYYVLLT